MLIWEVQQKIELKGDLGECLLEEKSSVLSMQFSENKRTHTPLFLNVLFLFSFPLVVKTKTENDLLSLFSQKDFLEERNVTKCLMCKPSRISCKLGQGLSGIA